MTTVTQATDSVYVLPQPRHAIDNWLFFRSQQRLSHAFAHARMLPVDAQSRIIFFSDLHRGAGNRADVFAPNADLFNHAMRHYFDAGFHYIEVGDGDELWQQRTLAAVKAAHGAAFAWLHRFRQLGRLNVIVGNHDIPHRGIVRLEKDGIICEDGIKLHLEGADRPLFVVHGHQADARSDTLADFSRLIVRWLWNPLISIGAGDLLTHLWCKIRPGAQRDTQLIERNLLSWIDRHSQPVICGHTHRRIFGHPSQLPYLNIGSGVEPGVITGIELQNGYLTPIRWLSDALTGSGMWREQIAPALPLAALL